MTLSCPESTIWRSSSVWWSGWERTSAVSKYFGPLNSIIHLWDLRDPFVLVFVSTGTTWTHQERLCSVTPGPSGLHLRGLRALYRRFTTRYQLSIYFIIRILSQRTIGIIRSNFSGFFLVYDTEGCHQIFPDHSEAGDGGEAERH